jgi:hypothetical protein
VAGTASAVAGRVNRRQQNKWGAQDQQAAEAQAYEQQQYAPPPPQYAAPPPQYAPAPAAPAAPADDYLDKLAQLGKLHADGILSDDEFAVQKAKILNG